MLGGAAAADEDEDTLLLDTGFVAVVTVLSVVAVAAIVDEADDWVLLRDDTPVPCILAL